MNEFGVLLEKVAQRLAKNYKPHRVTLNKLYAYPIDPAFREYRFCLLYTSDAADE